MTDKTAYVLRDIKDLAPGDHICCIYETEEEHRVFLTRYLRQGLERNEKVIYLNDTSTADVIHGYLEDDGLKIEPFLESGQLCVISAEDAYTKDAVFDPDRVIALLQNEIESALAEGYDALRATGEMTWVLNDIHCSERLLEYEVKLGAFFTGPGNKCLGVCQYDKNKFGAEVLLGVLSTHPVAIIGSEVVDNCFYVPPEEPQCLDPAKAKLEYRLHSITARKKTVQKVKFLSEITENMANGVVLMRQRDLVITYTNKKYDDLFGYKRGELIGKHISILNAPADKSPEEVARKIEHYLKTKGVWEGEVLNVKKDGARFWTQASISSFEHYEYGSAWVCVQSDITERKMSEDQIEDSLKEKEVLLQEIHHRVKNNLQVIISMLRLQGRKIDDKRYSDMLRDSQYRIRTMSLIHEKLYRSKSFTNVDLRGYIDSLAEDLFRSYGADKGRIAIKMEIGDVSLGLEHAIPCGLIIHELLSNSVKHAFPEGREGEIRIAISTVNEDDIELTISDNGIGLPKGTDISSNETMGLDLVRTLVEYQLEGNIELDEGEGTKYNISFKRQSRERGIYNGDKGESFDRGR